MHPDQVAALADANESYARKDYHKVVDILDIKLHGEVDLSLRAHCLKLCCLCEIYEDNNEDRLDRHLGNFRFFLLHNKEKISKKNIEGSKNLIKVVELMINYQSKKKIQDFVKSCKFLVFRSWVESKISL